MAECNKFRELIQADLDGFCSSEEQAALQAHLQQCESCREYARQQRQMKAALSDWENAAPALPAGFHDDIMKRIAAEPARKPISIHRRSLAGFAACAAVVAIVYLAHGSINLVPHETGSTASQQSVAQAETSVPAQEQAPAEKAVPAPSSEEAKQEAESAVLAEMPKPAPSADTSVSSAADQSPSAARTVTPPTTAAQPSVPPTVAAASEPARASEAPPPQQAEPNHAEPTDAVPTDTAPTDTAPTDTAPSYNNEEDTAAEPAEPPASNPLSGGMGGGGAAPVTAIPVTVYADAQGIAAAAEWLAPFGAEGIYRLNSAAFADFSAWCAEHNITLSATETGNLYEITLVET